jgi:hypothetical protein
MVLLEILASWFVLSCVTAPLIGRFIAGNVTIVEAGDTIGIGAAPGQAQRVVGH